MIEYTSVQMYLTTAEEEQCLDLAQCRAVEGDGSALPPGLYRVVDGELYAVMRSRYEQ